MKPSLSQKATNRSTWSRFVHSPITLGIIFIASIYGSVAVYAQWQKERGWQDRVQEMVQEVDVARRNNASLQDRVAYAASDAGKEAQLRQSFDVARVGEKLVVLPEIKKDTSLTVEEAVLVERSFWQRVTAWLFQ